MAVTTTEILGTDSISASRIVINDNFNILRDEINSIEAFIDPDAGTIDGLNSLITQELNVGPIGNYHLEVTGSVFNINKNLNVNNGLNITGIVTHDSFGVLDESNFSGSTSIDPINGFANYSIIQNSTSDFIIELEEGEHGQEVSFFAEQNPQGRIIIKAANNVTFTISPDPTLTEIELLNAGSSVTLRYVLDSTNNPSWYIVGQYAASII